MKVYDLTSKITGVIWFLCGTNIATERLHVAIEALTPRRPGDHIDLLLAHQLPLGADAKKVFHKQRRKEHLSDNRPASVVRRIERFDHLPNEPEVNCSINLAQKVIVRNLLFRRDHPNRCLLQGAFAQHAL